MDAVDVFWLMVSVVCSVIAVLAFRASRQSDDPEVRLTERLERRSQHPKHRARVACDVGMFRLGLFRHAYESIMTAWSRAEAVAEIRRENRKRADSEALATALAKADAISEAPLDPAAWADSSAVHDKHDTDPAPPGDPDYVDQEALTPPAGMNVRQLNGSSGFHLFRRTSHR
jgi:hypothetical protein